MTMREFLDALSVELTVRGVPHELIDSQSEREPGDPPYIAVSDQDGRIRRAWGTRCACPGPTFRHRPIWSGGDEPCDIR